MIKKMMSWQKPKRLSSFSADFLNLFLEVIINRINAKKILYIQHSEYFENNVILKNIKHDLFHDEYPFKSDIPQKGKWDLVLGDFQIDISDPKKNTSIKKTIESLKLISSKGIGIFLLPNYFIPFERFDLRKEFKINKLRLSAIIKLPKDFYVRTNPATDRLEGEELVEYVKKRFIKR